MTIFLEFQGLNFKLFQVGIDATLEVKEPGYNYVFSESLTYIKNQDFDHRGIYHIHHSTFTPRYWPQLWLPLCAR